MAKARSKRGIKEIFAMREGGSPVSVAQLACGDMSKSKSEGGRCVAAQTGSKSNIINVPSLATDPVSEAQLASGDMIKARGDGGRCVTAQTGSVIINAQGSHKGEMPSTFFWLPQRSWSVASLDHCEVQDDGSWSNL